LTPVACVTRRCQPRSESTKAAVFSRIFSRAARWYVSSNVNEILRCGITSNLRELRVASVGLVPLKCPTSWPIFAPAAARFVQPLPHIGTLHQCLKLGTDVRSSRIARSPWTMFVPCFERPTRCLRRTRLHSREESTRPASCAVSCQRQSVPTGSCAHSVRAKRWCVASRLSVLLHPSTPACAAFVTAAKLLAAPPQSGARPSYVKKLLPPVPAVLSEPLILATPTSRTRAICPAFRPLPFVSEAGRCVFDGAQARVVFAGLTAKVEVSAAACVDAVARSPAVPIPYAIGAVTTSSMGSKAEATQFVSTATQLKACRLGATSGQGRTWPLLQGLRPEVLHTTPALRSACRMLRPAPSLVPSTRALRMNGVISTSAAGGRARDALAERLPRSLRRLFRTPSCHTTAECVESAALVCHRPAGHEVQPSMPWGDQQEGSTTPVDTRIDFGPRRPAVVTLSKGHRPFLVRVDHLRRGTLGANACSLCQAHSEPQHNLSPLQCVLPRSPLVVRCEFVPASWLARLVTHSDVTESVPCRLVTCVRCLPACLSLVSPRAARLATCFARPPCVFVPR